MTTQTVPGRDRHPDPQAKAVYAWERDFVEPRIGDVIMSREQCQGMVRRAAALLRVAEPTIEFAQLPDVPCLAIPARNALRIATWGREHVTLLHEVAHLGTWPLVLTGEAPHGPSFVSCAIRLYAHFLGIDARWLEQKAAMRGISFIPGLLPALGYHPPRGGDLFPGEI